MALRATSTTISASCSHSASNTLAVTDSPSTAAKRPRSSKIGAAMQQKFESNSSRSTANPSALTPVRSSATSCGGVMVCA